MKYEQSTDVWGGLSADNTKRTQGCIIVVFKSEDTEAESPKSSNKKYDNLEMFSPNYMHGYRKWTFSSMYDLKEDVISQCLEELHED